MSLQQTFYGVAQPIVNQTNAGVSSLSGSISGSSSGGSVSSFTNIYMTGNSAPFIGSVNFLSSGTEISYLDIGGASAYNVSSISTCLIVGKTGGTWGDVILGDVYVAGSSVPPGSERAPQLTSDNTGVLYVNANNVSTANLQVSSINGQAPGGGGGGPVIGTSSITTSTINFEATQDSGMFYPPDGKKIANEVGIALTPLTGQYGNTGVVGAWGKEVYQGAEGYGEFAVQRLYLVDATGGATNQTRIENYGNQIQIETTSSISLQADTYVTGSFNTSTINVSSINGQPPPVGQVVIQGSVSSIGSLPISNSIVYQTGSLQTVQFQCNLASTLNTISTGFIPMLLSSMAPGNWKWQSIPCVSLNGNSVSGAGAPFGANVSIAGDPGDLTQEVDIHYRITDTSATAPTNLLVQMTGQKY